MKTKTLIWITAAVVAGLFTYSALAKEVDDKVPTGAIEEIGTIHEWNPVVQLSNGCTGFYIGNGVFLSAGHCMGSTKAWTLNADNANGGKRSFPVDTTVYSNPDDWNGQDTAIIYVNPVLTKELKPLELDCSGKVWPVGTGIAVEGFPETLGRVYVTGTVSGAPSPWGPGKGGWYKDVYRMQLPLSYGNSGSPVFNLDTGKVIGIAVGVLPNNRALSVFQPIDFACRVMGLSD